MAPSERRTQAERRSGTRAALLDATIASLVEVGFARTTTTEVTRRAGVSQGALFRHFPTKSTLVAAATERLFGDLVADFAYAFERGPEPEAAVVVALRRLWEVFCKPELQAVYRLYVEAPFDAELMAALTPIVKEHERQVAAQALALFPEIGASPLHEALFATALFAMQGLALQRPVYVDPAQEARVLQQFEALALTLFAAAHQPG